MKILKLDSFINFINSVIENKAVIKATKAAENDWVIFTWINSPLNKFNSDKVIEANMIGIDNNIENLAALSLSYPKKRAPVIVTPDLLAPGIKANTWKRPIISASIKVIFFQFLFLILILSAKNKTIAKKILDIAIRLIQFVRNSFYIYNYNTEYTYT